MAKSKVQFQKGYSLFEFFKDYGTEEQCENALLAWRFPHGFVCPECANKTFCRLKSRPRVLQCNHCRHQMSLTGNTMRGSCHKLGAKNLPRHLAEYCFRFNHRFDLKSMLVELGHAVMASPPMPYRLLKLAESHG